METNIAESSWPIVGCLIAAERFLGKDREWFSINPTQVAFIQDHFSVCRRSAGGIVDSYASLRSKDIVAWLAQRGFTVSIDPFNKNEFGAASVLDVLLEWPENTAVRSAIHLSDGEHSAVMIRRGLRCFRSPLLCTGINDVIFEVPTKDARTRVYMMPCVPRPQTLGFDIVEYGIRC